MNRTAIKAEASRMTAGIRPSLFFPMFVVLLVSAVANMLIIGIVFNLVFIYMNSIFILMFTKTGKTNFGMLWVEFNDTRKLFAITRPALMVFLIPFVAGLLSSLISGLVGIAGIYWLTSTVTMITSVVAAIVGIFVYIDYYFVAYLMYDSDYRLTTKEVMTLSRRMALPMRWDIFLFELSFIGHWLLVGLSLGIYAIWFVPYRETARVLFYDNVKEMFLSHNDDELANLIREYTPEPDHHDNGVDFDDIHFDNINDNHDGDVFGV